MPEAAGVCVCEKMAGKIESCSTEQKVLHLDSFFILIRLAAVWTPLPYTNRLWEAALKPENVEAPSLSHFG